MSALKHQKGNGRGEQLTDEIDLLAILIHIITLVKKHRQLILFIFLAGFSSSTLYYFMRKPVYESSFACTISFVQRTDIEHLLSTLNNYVAEDNHHALTKELPLPQHSLSALQKISLVPGTENTSSSSYTIKVTVTSPLALPEIQEALIKNIKTNSYTQQVLTRERESYKQRIGILETQKKELDSIFTSLQKNSMLAYARDYINLADLLKLKIDLEKEKTELVTKLSQLESVTVVRKFPQYITPSNKNPKLIAAIGLALSFFLCIGIIAILELSSVIRQQKTDDYQEYILDMKPKTNRSRAIITHA